MASPPKKPAASARKRVPDRDEFERVFGELRSILVPYEATLAVVRDRPGEYRLDTRRPGPRKVPIMFAGVRVNKSYVSYHLMPVYVAEMEISAELGKRMQGKACFNFSVVDRALIDELARLTRHGYEGWREIGWVE
jgi:hypothetical protein